MLTLVKGEKVLAVGVCQSSNLYRLDVQFKRKPEEVTHSSFAQLSKTMAQPISVWHQRLGHVSNSTIKKMEQKGMVDDLTITPGPDGGHVCFCCAFGKLHRLPFPTSGRIRAAQVGTLIHSDVCGPMSKPSPGEARFFVIFKDD